MLANMTYPFPTRFDLLTTHIKAKSFKELSQTSLLLQSCFPEILDGDIMCTGGEQGSGE